MKIARVRTWYQDHGLMRRNLTGLIEGGFIPDAILYLSYFYTNKELPMRMGFFYCASNGTFIIAAFLAFGILHMRSIGGWEGWRWLFAIEGGITCLIGIVSWFYLPASPTQTAGSFRGKDGWFSEREEVIMVNRVLRDDPAKVRKRSAVIIFPLSGRGRKCIADKVVYREECTTVRG